MRAVTAVRSADFQSAVSRISNPLTLSNFQGTEQNPPVHDHRALRGWACSQTPPVRPTRRHPPNRSNKSISYIAPPSPLWGPRCAKRTSLIGPPTRGGLGKPLGRGEVAFRFQSFPSKYTCNPQLLLLLEKAGMRIPRTEIPRIEPLNQIFIQVT